MKLIKLPNCDVFIGLHNVQCVGVVHNSSTKIYSMSIEFVGGGEQFVDLNTKDIEKAKDALHEFVSYCNSVL